MRLTRGVILSAARQIMHAAVDLDCNTLFADREIDDVAANSMLAHDVNAVAAQGPQRFPGALFGNAHAGFGRGGCRARRMSQAPMAIIGRHNNMPMVTKPRSASGICASGSRTNSSARRQSP